MEREMARIVDNQGNLLGGIEMPLIRLSASINKLEKPVLLAPTDAPPDPIYGPKENVRWLVCSYGSLPTVVYSASGKEPNVGGNDLHPNGCHNQVDKPHKRYYCPVCGGYYCVAHADPAAHGCRSVMRPSQAPAGG